MAEKAGLIERRAATAARRKAKAGRAISLSALARALSEEHDSQGPIVLGSNEVKFAPLLPPPPLSDLELPRVSLSSISSDASGHPSLVSLASASSTTSQPPLQGLRPRPGGVGASQGSRRGRDGAIPSAAHVSAASGNAAATSGSTRAYWCTSCDAKFAVKAGWRRHEEEFHERYKKYPCPDCPRVFWGASTFSRHHTATHGRRKSSPASAESVVRYSKAKRAWACGFCAALLPSRDRFYDHVGLHYESGKTKGHWFHSNVIYGLLHQRPIHEVWKGFIAVTYGHLGKGCQPMFSWNPRRTGRARGFLEDDLVSGHLQDRLEFFCEDVENVQQLVQLAHDLADIISPADARPGSQLHQLVQRPMSCPRPTTKTKGAFTQRHFSAPLLRRSGLPFDGIDRRESLPVGVPRYSLGPRPWCNAAPPTIAEVPELDYLADMAETPATPAWPATPASPTVGSTNAPALGVPLFAPRPGLDDWASMTSTMVEHPAPGLSTTVDAVKEAEKEAQVKVEKEEEESRGDRDAPARHQLSLSPLHILL